MYVSFIIKFQLYLKDHQELVLLINGVVKRFNFWEVWFSQKVLNGETKKMINHIFVIDYRDIEFMEEQLKCFRWMMKNVIEQSWNWQESHLACSFRVSQHDIPMRFLIIFISFTYPASRIWFFFTSRNKKFPPLCHVWMCIAVHTNSSDHFILLYWSMISVWN